MPKMKTHRGAAKRFKLTGSGKIKRARANKRHIMTGKAPKRTRRLRQTTTMDVADRHIKRLIPYA
jgi:large subunit ribosomal protein L35